MSAPLKKKMRCVDDTDKDGTGQSATKAIPECRHNDRQVIQSLIDVMQIRQMKRCQIMQQADADYAQE